MTDETMRLAAEIAGGLSDYMFSRTGPWGLAGEVYELATDEQYEALGEDVTATDLPLILVRKGDGKMFEVELGAHVTETSPERRKAQAERLRAVHERHEKIAGKELKP